MRTVNENCKREVRGKREVNARLFQEVLSDKVLNISYSSYATRKREFEYFEGRGDTQLLNDDGDTALMTALHAAVGRG